MSVPAQDRRNPGDVAPGWLGHVLYEPESAPAPKPPPEDEDPHIEDPPYDPPPAQPVGEDPVPGLPPLDDDGLLPTPARMPPGPDRLPPHPSVPAFQDLIDEWLDLLRRSREDRVPNKRDIGREGYGRGTRRGWVRRLNDSLLDQLEERRRAGEGWGAETAGEKESILGYRRVREPMERLIGLLLGGWDRNHSLRGPYAPPEVIYELARRMRMLRRCIISPMELLDWIYEQLVPPVPPSREGDRPGGPGTPATPRQRVAQGLRRQIADAIRMKRGFGAPPFFRPGRPRTS